MNKRTLLTTIAFGVAVSLPAFSAPLARAGDTLPRYLLFDIGSFGGKFSTFCYPNCRQLNNRGEAVGIDATSFPDPFNPCFYDCNVDYAFKWRYGGTNDLGSLQYLAGSWAQGINDSGISAGLSLNGKYDKKTQFWQARGVVWKNGKVINIGTLGGYAKQCLDDKQCWTGCRRCAYGRFQRSIHQCFSGELPVAADKWWWLCLV